MTTLLKLRKILIALPLCAVPLVMCACVQGPSDTPTLNICGPSQSAPSTGTAVGLGAYPSAQGGRRLAQSFITSGPIDSIDGINLLLSRVGSPDNTSVTVSITKNTGTSTAGYPVSSSPLATGSLAVNSTSSVISTTPTFYEILVLPKVRLETNTIYWIVLTPGYDVNSTDYIAWTASDAASEVSGRGLFERVQPNQGWTTAPSSTGTGAKNYAFQLICPEPESP